MSFKQLPTAIFSILIIMQVALPESARAQVETLHTEEGVMIKVEDIAEGLNHPWGMAFLPDGRLLLTVRNTGKLHILDTGHNLSAALPGTPEVWANGQGGLLDVALHPDFEENNYVYLSYSKPGAGGTATTALGRGQLMDDELVGFEMIFEQQPYVDGPNHFGNRIAFSPDGQYLYLALGERFQFDPAQDLSNHLGKVIRIAPDGSVPEGNPYIDTENAEAEIWSFGHRNIEAMAFHPTTNDLWVVEMGPLGGDELNKVEAGANYGWPEVSWGDHYDGEEIPDPDPGSQPQFEDAAYHWSPVISPSGMAFYEGEVFPEWNGMGMVGGLSSRALIMLSFEGDTAKEAFRLPLSSRIRDVEVAPDGSIYLLTDADDGHIWRMSRM